MVKQIDLAQKKEQYLEFINTRKTIVISSKDNNGDPFISYAPFVKHDGKFYIYISKISDHYQYIEENDLIHIMLLADEHGSSNLFARERARFQCTSENLGNEGYEEIFTEFENIHGKPMMGVLRGLDFSLFELVPQEGRFVVGFGQAFDIDVLGERFLHVVVDKTK
ncbi:HugZ family protein [Bacillus massiliigorillae]|uniref:HugZ family pyridoxamine 5'-phosphate oxidase n=1 Tax=Bacillus massiliigorillae TaxID=1243664 RepID=UPI0003A48BE2|nr:pyridoxamine 5'-phosphate oxidase family protein [Bacillus massiliigorillae]